MERAPDVERAPASPDAPVADLVDGLWGFTADFSRLTADGDDNLVFSPASIAIAFAMAHAGAGDATAADIADAFGFPPGTELHEAVNTLTQSLATANTDEVIAELANSVWLQDGVEVGRPFLETMATYYGTGVETTDFANDAGASRDRINDWVAGRTRDRITELLDDQTITPQTVAVLVNAVYLKAAWDSPFPDETTADESFHLAGGSTVEVPTMRQEMLSTQLVQGDIDGTGYTGVKLPYEGHELSMLVVVPDEGTPLTELEARLDGAGLAGLAAELAPATVDLALPRWDIESALDLADPLSAMGVPLPGGDLSGISPAVELDAAVHAANITVDEEGTEAAAATAAIGVTSAPVPGEVVTVEVDRPFLFIVQHDETGAPLFYGRVSDPRG